jgi:glycosyltransferase involved in cell wall biosynthesis
MTRPARDGTDAMKTTLQTTAGTKVLFISHDAQPHGAQILLLHLVRWIAGHTSIIPHVLLKQDGPLRKDFAAVARTSIWPHDNAAAFAQKCVHEKYDVVYSNTVTNGALLEALIILDCPVISHVHELGYWIAYRSGALNNAQVVQHTDYYIAASRAVAACLHETLGLPEQNIFTIHEFVPARVEAFDAAAARERVRNELKISAGAQIIGGSGTTDWRKSPDLFVQLARAVKQRAASKEVHFIWVGGDASGPEFGMLWHDVKRLGLEKLVHFVGHKENPRDYFAAFDIFALTSREDPYPLVVLEAASLGLPILGFERSGGVGEFIEKDAGFLVPYLDIDAMAARACGLLADANLRQALGSRAREKATQRHDVNVAAPKIVNIIEWARLNHRLGQNKVAGKLAA